MGMGVLTKSQVVPEKLQFPRSSNSQGLTSKICFPKYNIDHLRCARPKRAIQNSNATLWVKDMDISENSWLVVDLHLLVLIIIRSVVIVNFNTQAILKARNRDSWQLLLEYCCDYGSMELVQGTGETAAYWGPKNAEASFTFPRNSRKWLLKCTSLLEWISPLLCPESPTGQNYWKLHFMVLGSKSTTATFLSIYAWVEPGWCCCFHFVSVSVQFAPKRLHIFRITCLVLQYRICQQYIDLFSCDWVHLSLNHWFPM